jgi:hypothetical protein
LLLIRANENNSADELPRAVHFHTPLMAAINGYLDKRLNVERID